MKSDLMLVVLAAFVGCCSVFSAAAQTAKSDEQVAAAPATNPFAGWAQPKESPPQTVVPPVLSVSYAGRWEAANTTGGTNSNTTSFTVKSQFQLDEKSGAYVARGTYTTYSSNAYGNVGCGTLVDIPMEIRWYPFEDQAFNLIATPTDTTCQNRRFRLVRDVSTGRLSWKNGNGTQSVYFDPDKG